MPMIKNEEIKTAIHVACTYLKQSKKEMLFSSTLVHHKIAFK